MRPLRHLLLSLLTWMLPGPTWADAASLLAKAQAEDAARYAAVVASGAEIRPTTDNQSFTIWWQPAGWTAASGVIVVLHGHDGFATTGAALWQPYAAPYGHAVLNLQWWFGGGESTADYYRPDQMYPLIAALLAGKGVKPGTVLFTGFSRGSANSYAVAVQDNTSSASKYFALVLSNAGSAVSDYPPNLAITNGAFGSLPFSGMKWAMYCGELDPEPNASGCAGMRASRDWVTRHGASVLLFIDDPTGEHGGFMLSSANIETALATYRQVLAANTSTDVLSTTEADCLFSWAEDSYASTFVPRRPPSLSAPPYRYRYYSGTNLYLGLSSTDHHVYLMDGSGRLTDYGLAAPWATRAGCR